MRFSKLRLNGFKSFVDATDLVIGDGLTGVVGPNGCGKSNLLEALRWVMGENRPTAMRGGGMEDVIFAGAATRGARNYAEVALTIDNEDRLAPSGFNDSVMLEVVRRITRDAGSNYKINGKDVRARDVQMLFADASTGAHSPALVRQGQISELINAKPRARRRVLEEAAGISGLYQRRHEAELRLSAAETNLTRVDDVIEQLAQQLISLSRQARQAARYREIGRDLKRAEGMLLARRWHEAEVARQVALTQFAEALRLTAEAEARAADTAEAREAAEEALPGLREEDNIAAALLQRLILQRETLAQEESRATERVAALRARIAQLARDAEREAVINRDAGETIRRLEWELEQLARAQDGEAGRLDELATLAQEAAVAVAAVESRLSEATEDAAELAARAQGIRRARDEGSAALERARSEAARAHDAAEAASEALEVASEAFTEAEEAQAEALEAATEAEERLAGAEEAREALQAREAGARAARATAEGDLAALKSEAAGLERLLARATSDSGEALIERLSVAPGYEAALGAALADDLRAPEIRAEDPTGWAPMADYTDAEALPAGLTALSAHVSAPDVLARRLGRIGIVERSQGAALQAQLRPGQRLVSREGDLWRWDGYRAAAGDAPSSAALRLQQVNRLAALRDELTLAEAKAAEAAALHSRLQSELAALTQADQFAREQRRTADSRLTEASRRLARAEGDRSLAAGRLEAARQAGERARQAADDAAARLEEAAEAEASLPDLADLRARVEALKTEVEAARSDMIARRATHEEAKRDGEARTRRRQEVMKELSGWRHRLETAERHSEDLQERREAAEEDLAEALEQPDEILARREELSEAVEAAETRRQAAQNRLGEAEAALRAAQDAERLAATTLATARETRARAETRAEATKEATAAAAARIREDLEQEPAELLDALGTPPDQLPDAAELDLEAQRLRRSRDQLGAVNLRAEEDALAVQTEHDNLRKEKEELEEAIRKLRSGISSLNREGRERLLAAYDVVNGNFSLLFTHLFNGGEARLVMVESDDPLEAGLEIMCQPPGKKLSTLSLLSGGEQTLTALALIFAVFLANPAPICVLDEVDAPLDDANVTRFCDLLDEMTRRTDTRFLIITHHGVTMSRMDRLFGVTMQEQGVSQLVSVDLKRAEALVA